MTALVVGLDSMDDDPKRLIPLKCASIKNPISAHAPASLLGDHSVSAPPDPIPNSTVKPDRADGTIAQALEE